MPGKKSMSVEQHEVIGRKLWTLRHQAMEIDREIEVANGKSKKVSKKARSIVRFIDSLRSDLENLMCSEHPGRDFRGVYYGVTDNKCNHRICDPIDKSVDDDDENNDISDNEWTRRIAEEMGVIYDEE